MINPQILLFYHGQKLWQCDKVLWSYFRCYGSVILNSYCLTLARSCGSVTIKCSVNLVLSSITCRLSLAVNYKQTFIFVPQLSQLNLSRYLLLWTRACNQALKLSGWGRGIKKVQTPISLLLNKGFHDNLY